MKEKQRAGRIGLTPNEVRIFFEQIQNTMIKVALFLVHFCDLPLCEVANIKMADVDLNQKLLLIRSKTIWGERYIRLPYPIIMVIKAWLQQIESDKWLFLCNKSHISVSTLSNAVKLASQKSGIQASIKSIRISSDINATYYGFEDVDNKLSDYYHDSKTIVLFTGSIKFENT